MAASQERKIDVVKVLMDAYGLKLSEILFVDDEMNNVEKMKAMGIMALHVSEVDPNGKLKKYMDD